MKRMDSNSGCYNSFVAERVWTPSYNNNWLQAFMIFFYIYLTVHLGIILVNNQLDALFFNVFICHFSTRFEHPVLFIRRIELYQNIVWYVSLCIGNCLAWLTVIPATYTEWYIPDDVLIQFDSPDDGHRIARNVYRSDINKYIEKKKCVKLVINKNKNLWPFSSWPIRVKSAFCWLSQHFGFLWITILWNTNKIFSILLAFLSVVRNSTLRVSLGFFFFFSPWFIRVT
jgi:hypothetical protein